MVNLFNMPHNIICYTFFWKQYLLDVKSNTLWLRNGLTSMLVSSFHRGWFSPMVSSRRENLKRFSAESMLSGEVPRIRHWIKTIINKFNIWLLLYDSYALCTRVVPLYLLSLTIKRNLWYPVIKLGRYHDIIEYRDTKLDTISISDRFGFNWNIDILR